MKELKGIGVSSGIACFPVLKLINPQFNITEKKISENAKNTEKAKVTKAIEIAVAQLEEIKSKTEKKFGLDQAAIFQAHIDIVKDASISKQIFELIDNQLFNAIYATKSIFEKTHAMFLNMDNPYFKERANDIIDIMQRVLCILSNQPLPNLLSINQPVIIIANDLTPSQSSMLDKQYIKGVITEIGSKTSHSAFIVQANEIPSVFGINKALANIKDNELVALDGAKGIVYFELKNKDVISFQEAAKKYQLLKKQLKAYVTMMPVISKDKKAVQVAANIGTPNDMKLVQENGAQGVGLFRTEFLYMESSSWPTEEVQFQTYKEILTKANQQPVVIRTLDIGGDKQLNYYTFPTEMNPFLGYRAIRFCLDNQDIFRTQLRALIRASIYGKLHIMFPMIAVIEEFVQAKKIFQEEYKKLVAKKIKVSRNIKLGMMVEIPSAAMLIDKFAQVADFFSIGSNDLIQYSFACDRMSKQIAYLYQPNNPALLRLIFEIIKKAHQYKKWVGMCGQMAGEPLSIPLLLGMGLDEFSMSPSLILNTKRIINKIQFKNCQALVKKALSMSSTSEVEHLVQTYLAQKKLL